MNDLDARSKGTGTTLQYTAPFVVFLLFLALGPSLIRSPIALGVAWVAGVGGVIWIFSRSVLPRVAPFWLQSIGVGLVVLGVWIAPDFLIAGYRSSALFQNPLLGTVQSSVPVEMRHAPLWLTLRFLRAVLIVPIAEELFWRGWLPRWMVDMDVSRVPLGFFRPITFVATAVLFASEHGSFWEVGLLAGLVYNWYLQKTRSLGDLMIAHATTNAGLAVLALWRGHWEYW